ncbi:hypothetical protein EOD41_04180 [Mucilaginibacter limnophilus]|uniref:Uncharacterized protein n=1 Tax=Mucilaginibacter limnophilus TaxID=1932778 RepID=A0A437MZU3_9SPHI|nr:hypothetical protein [Mucilaginibacter limnophilus]RVU03136.1 hypothetical protein EOD41_04180 [Mucilaginibacter limnophilus]
MSSVVLPNASGHEWIFTGRQVPTPVFSPEELRVGLHSPGFMAANDEKAVTMYYPGHIDQWNRIGRECGWAPVTRQQFEQHISPVAYFGRLPGDCR